jgi:hypothetical protein
MYLLQKSIADYKEAFSLSPPPLKSITGKRAAEEDDIEIMSRSADGTAAAGPDMEVTSKELSHYFTSADLLTSPDKHPRAHSFWSNVISRTHQYSDILSSILHLKEGMYYVLCIHTSTPYVHYF